jgi:DNA-binding LytR/AlgR family response regulator
MLYDPLCIPDPEGFRFIDPSEIIYIESNNSYCNIYCINKVQYKMVRLTVQEITSRLSATLFHRVHRCYVVSRLHIITINKSKTRIHCVEDISIRIGDTYRPGFLGRFGL